jgi:hypothetical protein
MDSVPPGASAPLRHQVFEDDEAHDGVAAAIRAAEAGAAAASIHGDAPESREARRKKKKLMKKLAAGKLTDGNAAAGILSARDLSSLYAGAKASFELMQQRRQHDNVRVQAARDLLLWMFTQAPAPTWVFVRNKALVSNVVLVLLRGLSWQQFSAGAAPPSAALPTLRSMTHIKTRFQKGVWRSAAHHTREMDAQLLFVGSAEDQRRQGSRPRQGDRQVGQASAAMVSGATVGVKRPRPADAADAGEDDEGLQREGKNNDWGEEDGEGDEEAEEAEDDEEEVAEAEEHGRATMPQGVALLRCIYQLALSKEELETHGFPMVRLSVAARSCGGAPVMPSADAHSATTASEFADPLPQFRPASAAVPVFYEAAAVCGSAARCTAFTAPQGYMLTRTAHADLHSLCPSATTALGPCPAGAHAIAEISASNDDSGLGTGTDDAVLLAADCEMCTTASGAQLARLTVVRQDETVALDTLVVRLARCTPLLL